MFKIQGFFSQFLAFLVFLCIYGHFWLTPDLISSICLMENLGEAAPQIALSITFLVNNYMCEHLHSWNLFGMEIPTTKVSLFFSTGSLIIGAIRTMPSFIQSVRKERDTRRILKNTQKITGELKTRLRLAR